MTYWRLQLFDRSGRMFRDESRASLNSAWLAGLPGFSAIYTRIDNSRQFRELSRQFGETLKWTREELERRGLVSSYR